MRKKGEKETPKYEGICSYCFSYFQSCRPAHKYQRSRKYCTDSCKYKAYRRRKGKIVGRGRPHTERYYRKTAEPLFYRGESETLV